MENKTREGEIFQTEFEKISKRIDEKISELYETLDIIISNIEEINSAKNVPDIPEDMEENGTSLHKIMLSIERRLHILCLSIKI